MGKNKIRKTVDCRMIELNDFPTVCRICLEKRRNLISIFTEIIHLNDKSYREMLKECASVHIFEDDSLPKNLCIECSKNLEQSYKLKIQCLSSEKRLHTLIENSTQRNVKIEESILQNGLLDNDFEFYNDDDDDDNKDDDFNLYETKTNYPVSEVEIIIKEEEPEAETTDDGLKNSSNNNNNNNRKSSSVVNNNYKCTECEGGAASFTCVNELFEHNKDVHGKDVVPCQYCQVQFNNGPQLEAHCSGSSNVCKWCMKDCGCVNSLIEHTEEHNACDKCGKTFNNVEACRRHIQIHKEVGYLCQYCGKSFADRRNMTIHTRTHTGEKPYECKLCDAKFKDSYHLKEHMTKHSAERKYECDICNAKYKWKEGLRQHKLSQHTDGEFACNYCDKRCKTKKYLHKHQFVHSGEWKHICTYCNKSFNRSDNLKVHLRIHTGEKPFVCNKCGRGFSAKHVMNGHMKTCNIQIDVI